MIDPNFILITSFLHYSQSQSQSDVSILEMSCLLLHGSAKQKIESELLVDVEKITTVTRPPDVLYV